ncbi:MAG: hypothetical protein J1E32_07460 [Treponema sp.]|nr:hypothetical protein [Treponema sp.]
MALNKSKDRLLYLIGMAATFIGLLIPYVRTDEGSVLNIISGASFQHPLAAKTA